MSQFNSIRPNHLPADAIQALHNGNKISAIKIVRECYGLGLAESLQLIEATNLDTVQVDSSARPRSEDSTPAYMGSDLPSNVKAAADAGDKVEAIKLLREASGLGLRESKEKIEAYTSKNRVKSTTNVGTNNRKSLLINGLVILGIALIIFAVVTP